MLLYVNAMFVCERGWVGGWIFERVPAETGVHSYVNGECMQACIRRRDPYHGHYGIMRSATVGYPQTEVIMDSAKRTDGEEVDGLSHTKAEASVLPTAHGRRDDGLPV